MDPSLQDTGLAIKRLQTRHQRAADAALAELGITFVQWDALRHVERNPTASLHALARLTSQTDQSFGALAARLEMRGLVYRSEGPGRAVRLSLSPTGVLISEAGDRIMDLVLAESFSPLSPQQLKVFADTLQRLLSPPPTRSTGAPAPAGGAGVPTQAGRAGRQTAPGHPRRRGRRR